MKPPENIMKRLLLYILGSVLFCLVPMASAAPADSLETSFQHPPASARPWVYWFPLNGNLTKVGITADLEAMARVGIGGALYMEVNPGNATPKGAADFAGPLWMEMVGHACREAKRLGLEINMNNDAGWNGSGGPWITPELSMQKVVWSEVVVNSMNTAPIVLPQPKSLKDYYEDIAVLAMPAPDVNFRMPDIARRAFYKCGNGPNILNLPSMSADFSAAPAGAVIPRDQVMDVSKFMSRDGKLSWSPPAGKWLVMRFGHTTTGVDNHPAPAAGKGLECDKLSAAATTFHFEHLMGRLVGQNRALTGQDKALVGVHIDSWENGAQNWTPLMREEFKKRRGYDILPFLPVLSGRILGSTEITERFLWDLRQTVSEMLIENYAGTFEKLARKNGLRLTIEAYGEPADDLAYGGRADEPMGEFWAWERFRHSWSCPEMASAGHTYGRQIIGAEAFTSSSAEKWQGYPGNIKDLGDWAFCEGINRFVFHRYAAQPWTNAAPGMSMGPYGLHYERTQTWWEQSKAWHEYLARCQSLLQQGQFVADIAYLAPEDAPSAFIAPPEAESAPHIRSGYGWDGCSTEVVLTRMSVKDGKIVLPDGMSYRALVLPPVETMTPSLLAKIKQLADAGAMIVGSDKPPRKSPSLADLGAGDEKVQKTAAALWASGKVLTGKTAQEFLAERGVPPDFSASPLLRHIHRRIGDADVYFVANPGTKDAVEAVADFRISGKQPELWWPDTGRMESLVSYQESKGVTRVALHLEPSGSVFVVFRKSSVGIDPIVELRHEGKLQWSLTQPLPAQPAAVAGVKITKAIYGVPGDPARTRDVTQKLQAIVDGGETKIRVPQVAKGGDPAPKVVKTLTVEYVVGGETLTFTGKDKDVFTPQGPGLVKSAVVKPAAQITGETGGGTVLSATQPGSYELQTASGKTKKVNVPALPAALEIPGPWHVRFAPAAGGPGDVSFEKLEDWSKRAEEGIKYYSGTAVYQTTFVAGPLSANTKWMLDLGRVEVMSEVKLNGKDLGILWKSPYQVDVTAALQPGKNQLELKVVNLWINRLIGDENLPEDSDRNKNSTLKSWPEWLQQGKPSPTGRISFTSWRLWKKGDPLSPSGLLGPVRLIPVEQVPVP
jgi:hypothetical protein